MLDVETAFVVQRMQESCPYYLLAQPYTDVRPDLYHLRQIRLLYCSAIGRHQKLTDSGAPSLKSAGSLVW